MSRRARTPVDLGPVPFSARLSSEPFASEQPVPEPGVGFLADLGAAWASAWSGTFTVSFGEASLRLAMPDSMDCLEEFWVFLLELVDVGHGEWSLYDGADDLTLEAQVFGPDVQLEFTSEAGRPGFGGVELPDRALLRLRAVIAEGTGFFRQLLREARRVQPALGERAEHAGLLEDMDQLQAAVESLPATFKGAAG